MNTEMKILIEENRKLNEQLTKMWDKHDELEEYTTRLEGEYMRLKADFKDYQGLCQYEKEQLIAR